MEAENSRKRRRYAAELEAQILAECEQPGASVATVAMGHDINADIVHGWHKLAREAGAAPVPERFVPVAIAPVAPRVADERTAELELSLSGITVKLDPLWLEVQPLDVRAGTEAALARVVTVFGAARAHHAYLFANRLTGMGLTSPFHA